jgi:hypothetical protein
MKIWINITDDDGTLRERFSIGTEEDCAVIIDRDRRSPYTEADITERIMDEVATALAAEEARR